MFQIFRCPITHFFRNQSVKMVWRGKQAGVLVGLLIEKALAGWCRICFGQIWCSKFKK
jgi:hypothetical protein